MARSNAVVIREEAGREPLGGARGRGGRRPPTASAREEKQKIHMQASGPASSRRPRKAVLQDESFNVAEHREMDLMIARGETKGEASESSDDSLGNEEIEEEHIGGSSSGVGNRGTRGTRGTRSGRGSRGRRGNQPTTNEEEQDMSAPLPGGPIDWSLLLSFKYHIATVIWDNMVCRS
ncbi:hypothetical protein Scep_004225 [Stephania cephalantha]|uniref:Uncharacterized protein n=1 Tax=Stephania cephalantha TaxID=152367 RepID=A0AAP0KS64_9MAGN